MGGVDRAIFRPNTGQDSAFPQGAQFLPHSGKGDALRLFLATLVLILDVWAIATILGAQGKARTKLGWIIAVIALPLAGIVWWRWSAPKASSAQ
jgi:hypothetical protein